MTNAPVAVEAKELKGSGVSACASLVDHFLNDVVRKQGPEQWRGKQNTLFEQAQEEAVRDLGSQWIEDYIKPLVDLEGARSIFPKINSPEQVYGNISFIFLLGRGLGGRITEENKQEVYTHIIRQLIDRSLFDYAVLNPRNSRYDRQFGDTCEKFLDAGANSKSPNLVEFPFVPQSG
ncbi:hypothetical protein KKE03_02015 [Patescibacteria group bacterium]|nr:hypothetical protein [Patescibacteria group bacterium]